MNLPTRIAIRQHRPFRGALLAALAVVAAVGVGWQVFDTVTHRRELIQVAVDAPGDDLETELGAASETIEALRGDLVEARRNAEVDHRAYLALQEQAQVLQRRIFDLERELDFYRGALSGSSDVRGLSVQGIRFVPVDERRYAFRVILTHLGRDDRPVSGTARIEILGEQGGTPYVVPLAVGETGDSPLSFEFRHFGRLEGAISLPSGFVAKRVRIRLREKGETRPSVEREFAWTAVI